mmetsp:Transcript_25191/g.39558  ORF Transcript_25191/g.39558 Transcript_25191/m.39558 type:complete len:217 (+) Transcript_25191:3-653(+)
MVEADRLICALPQAVLRDADVKFNPSLPSNKVDALKKVRVGNAIKILLKVKEKFWPDDCWDVVCSDSFVPELWLTPAAKVLKKKKLPEYYWVGFIAGERSQRIQRMSHDEMARKMMTQLDTIFGTKDRPHPATDSCTGFIVKDWSMESASKAAYSFPSKDAFGKRGDLAAPLGRRVFFAGEATHEDVNPCIQAAMETGARAAKQVIDSLEVSRSKL